METIKLQRQQINITTLYPYLSGRRNIMRGQTAIIGYGELPTKRIYPGRTMNGLLADAAREAMLDAHIQKEDIDGLVVEGGSIYPTAVSEYMGMAPNFITGVSTMGASGATGVAVAAMAVYSGLAETVLVTLAGPRESGDPWGSSPTPGMRTEFENPYGPAIAANTGYALMYSRHMHEYGTTQEQLANIAVNQRFNALENPNAVFQGQPIEIKDVIDSRYINYPIRLLESVMPCAGAFACIVTSAERAKSFPNKPVYILGAGIASDPLTTWQRDRLTVSAVTRSAPIAFKMSGYGPKDIEFAEFYDCYTILEAVCLEDSGLVPKGEIGPFFAETDTTYKGSFPINTDGGQLSGGQPMDAGGFRHVIEATRQIMGRGGKRQVERNDLCLVNG